METTNKTPIVILEGQIKYDLRSSIVFLTFCDIYDSNILLYNLSLQV